MCAPGQAVGLQVTASLKAPRRLAGKQCWSPWHRGENGLPERGQRSVTQGRTRLEPRPLCSQRLSCSHLSIFASTLRNSNWAGAELSSKTVLYCCKKKEAKSPPPWEVQSRAAGILRNKVTHVLPDIFRIYCRAPGTCLLRSINN